MFWSMEGEIKSRRDYQKENKNYLELGGSKSYQGFELAEITVFATWY